MIEAKLNLLNIGKEDALKIYIGPKKYQTDFDRLIRYFNIKTDVTEEHVLPIRSKNEKSITFVDANNMIVTSDVIDILDLTTSNDPNIESRLNFCSSQIINYTYL